MQLLMMNEDLRGQTLENPGMAKGFVRGQPLVRVPFEASLLE